MPVPFKTNSRGEKVAQNIGNKGCVVTGVSNLLSLEGKTVNGKEPKPSTVLDYFKQVKGFQGNDLVWSKAEDLLEMKFDRHAKW